VTVPLVVIRPEPGNAVTVADAGKLGLSTISAPLFVIEARPWDAPDPATIDGLLIGSANAVRHGGSALQNFVNKPVYAVGEATAQTARDAGLKVAQTGHGGLQELLDALGDKRLTLLRLTGEEHVPLTPPAGIELVTRIAYASVPQPMPDDLATALQAGAVVLLHSAAAARHFASECARLGLDRARIALAAFGPRIAEAAGPVASSGWRALETAPEPTDAALLALAQRMCHAARDG
jgi:uroporphyrinogen-III synthase